MKRGEIRWYKFKSPDKKRPVLILTRDSVLEYLGEVTIAPTTSTVRDIPSEVFLSKHDGMKKDCAINFDHIQTVSKRKIGSLITTLFPEKLKQVQRAILFALDL
ncbi:type II toxin-antitoxin system PemK/MazF family toxin [bacterium]|nr:type II toxin-antitoxin system PemK/MazF family toxin [bacterium]MBU1614074.1 type II toxin-antitoxin system PemK/MazF family toxin [bacterium]